jgi:hypothetical protein
MNETANLNGLNQIGEPTRTRSSTRRPVAETTARAAMTPEKTVNGLWRPASRLGTDTGMDTGTDMDPGSP